MEFESPDVERDFPGLYESGKRREESDFSDESFDSKMSKKDLLIGKKKEKKDKGYATLEGESSPDDEADVKSPSKSKKSKAFKFSTKSKDKREKSKEKDIKEVAEKEKDSKKKDKDKAQKLKEKEKVKEKRKVKSGDDGGDIAEEAPVFGVTLEVANQRCPCHDGVSIPLVVRECIDHVEAHGLSTEHVYKASGLKSKVQQLKLSYNRREEVNLSSVEIPVASSLLKLFLRELAEPVIPSSILNKCEEVAGVKDLAVKESELKKYIEKLPSVNKMVLAWLLTHFNHVSSQEKANKMSSQLLAATLSPVLQMSSKLLTALLFHCEAILPPVELSRYIPPLTANGRLPETGPAIQEELKKQDSLLSQLHAEMNAGFVSKQREELLWEVQRMVTQLKRKLRVLEKGSVSQRSVEEDSEFALNLNLQQAKDDVQVVKLDQHKTLDQPKVIDVTNQRRAEQRKSMEAQSKSDKANDKQKITVEVHSQPPQSQKSTHEKVPPISLPKPPSSKNVSNTEKIGSLSSDVKSTSSLVKSGPVDGEVPIVSESPTPPGSIQSSSISIISSSIPDEEDTVSVLSESDFILKGLKMESAELLSLANFLQEAILDEKLKIAALNQKILSHPNYDSTEPLSVHLVCNDGADPTSDLVRESMRLEIQKENLIRSIIEEREAILDLKIQILMKQSGVIAT